MEDVLIGRQTVVAPKIVQAGAAATTPLCAYNEKRTSLHLSADGTATVFVGPKGMDLAALTGIVLSPNRPGIDIDIYGWGNAAASEWFAFNAGAATNIAVVETFLERSK
jgi:hypothetical protein